MAKLKISELSNNMIKEFYNITFGVEAFYYSILGVESSIHAGRYTIVAMENGNYNIVMLNVTEDEINTPLTVKCKITKEFEG